MIPEKIVKNLVNCGIMTTFVPLKRTNEAHSRSASMLTSRLPLEVSSFLWCSAISHFFLLISYTHNLIL